MASRRENDESQVCLNPFIQANGVSCDAIACIDHELRKIDLLCCTGFAVMRGYRVLDWRDPQLNDTMNNLAVYDRCGTPSKEDQSKQQ